VSASPVSFADVDRWVLIGGSDLMIRVAERLAQAGRRLALVVAPRYAGRPMGADGETLEQAAARLGADLIAVDNPNRTPDALSFDGAQTALCFGPAWVFGAAVRERFSRGMFNFNAIPQPRYIGGAHHSWQAMNGDLGGGAVVQEIDAKVDHGPIIAAAYYDYPADTHRPADYMAVKNERSRAFMADFIDRALAGETFERTDYAAVNAGRLYFPRLIGAVHAYIDWRWTAEQIAGFCAAFDAPYPGARTFLRGEELLLRATTATGEEPGIHPFCSGLIVRNLGDEILVAAPGGLLRVGGAARAADGADARGLLREGRRLTTPVAVLERALESFVEIDGAGDLHVRRAETPALTPSNGGRT
jgi:methionyl-tRNA formyltransferase